MHLQQVPVEFLRKYRKDAATAVVRCLIRYGNLKSPTTCPIAILIANRIDRSDRISALESKWRVTDNTVGFIQCHHDLMVLISGILKRVLRVTPKRRSKRELKIQRSASHNELSINRITLRLQQEFVIVGCTNMICE